MLNKTARSIYFVVASFLMLALVSTLNAQATVVNSTPAELVNATATYSESNDTEKEK